MGAQLRVYRRRIKSVQATKKITKAMELIASSRIVKAQQRLEASLPYLTHLYAAINAAATDATDVAKHPLMANSENRSKAAVLVITADRGLAGAYSSNAIKEAEALTTNLREKGITVVPYVVGRKGVSYYRFRGRDMGGEYVGFTDQPSYADAKRIGDDLLEAFMTPTEEGGVDEIHIVYTHFHSMVTQESRIRRILPAGGRRRGRRAVRRARPSRPSTSSSPMRSPCSTVSCRATSTTPSTPHCSWLRPPSMRPVVAR